MLKLMYVSKGMERGYLLTFYTVTGSKFQFILNV
jgi:hypothetical protein